MNRNSFDRWSGADFLHQSQELVRRLKVWHIQGAEPVYAPNDPMDPLGNFIKLMQAENEVFRSVVMRGEHKENPNFIAENVVEGNIIARPLDPHSKYIATWLFRNFIEHLARDVGESEVAKLVRMKIDRLLDAPAYRRARNEVFRDHIVGREVDPSLLSEFEEAVRDLIKIGLPEILETESPLVEPINLTPRRKRGKRSNSITPVERMKMFKIRKEYESAKAQGGFVKEEFLEAKGLTEKDLKRAMLNTRPSKPGPS